MTANGTGEVPLPVPPTPSIGVVQVLTATAAIAAITALLSLSGLAAYRRGVCCADDAFAAHVAKNLASGYGYASSVQTGTPYYQIVPFDPSITTGPTLILPVSLVLSLFGNRASAPGLTIVCINAVLLLSIYGVLRRNADGIRLHAAVALFVLLTFGLFSLHFEHWYALLGEVPATLLVILGAAFWASRPESPRHIAVAGLLFGLAVLSKLLALISLFGLVLAAGFGCGCRQRGLIRLLGRGAIIIGSFLAPVLLFESWKLCTEGLDGYAGGQVEEPDRHAGLMTGLGLGLRSVGQGGAIGGPRDGRVHVHGNSSVPWVSRRASSLPSLLMSQMWEGAALRSPGNRYRRRRRIGCGAPLLPALPARRWRRMPSIRRPGERRRTRRRWETS
jgi:hypothetical protein